MKTKEECRDDFAIENGYEDWNNMFYKLENYPLRLRQLVDEAMDLYAEQKWNEACEAQKIICSESATLTAESCGDPMSCGCQGRCDHPYYSVNKKSILNSPLPPLKA